MFTKTDCYTAYSMHVIIYNYTENHYLSTEIHVITTVHYIKLECLII